MDIKKIVNISKALSDENRVKIVGLLSCGEKCGCKLLEEFNITQPTLSHHMRVLVECDLILDRKDGKWHHYSINKNVLEEYLNFMMGLK